MENSSSFKGDKHEDCVHVQQQIARRRAVGNPEEIPCVERHTLCLIELLLGFINTAGNTLISSY